MTSNPEKQKFSSWLANRVNEAKLTTHEKNMFSNWLAKRVTKPESGTELKELYEQDSKHISMQEIKQFMGWLKDRMKETPLEPSERRQLGEWLANRVHEMNKFEAHEIESVRKELH